MKNNKTMFIKTKDKETSETLKSEGFQLVDYTDGIWTFMNDSNRPMIFDKNKVTYSNMLCI